MQLLDVTSATPIDMQDELVPSRLTRLNGCFPELFPFGRVHASLFAFNHAKLVEYAQWLMDYEDGRFSRNAAFVDALFMIVQDSEIQLSADTYTLHRGYNGIIQSAEHIGLEEVVKAMDEERRAVPYTDMFFTVLERHASNVLQLVKFTAESVTHLTSMAYGTTILHGSAHIMLRMTPNISVHSISRLRRFSGDSLPYSFEEEFDPDLGLSARIFHNTSTSVIQHLIGSRCHEWGVFGQVRHFVGAAHVEQDGKLSLRILVWLQGPRDRIKQKTVDGSARIQASGSIGPNATLSAVVDCYHETFVFGDNIYSGSIHSDALNILGHPYFSPPDCNFPVTDLIADPARHHMFGVLPTPTTRGAIIISAYIKSYAHSFQIPTVQKLNYMKKWRVGFLSAPFVRIDCDILMMKLRSSFSCLTGCVLIHYYIRIVIYFDI